jgi:hypothetical protein
VNRENRPRLWLRISAFGQPMGFELRSGDSVHVLTVEDAAAFADMGEWLTARTVDAEHVPTLVEAVGKLQAIARVLDDRAGRALACGPAVGEPAGHRGGIGRP